jgi:hypothetical protein
MMERKELAEARTAEPPVVSPARLDSPQVAEPPVVRVAEPLRRYTARVTASLILLCSGFYLLGVWGSGVSLESLFRSPDRFNPAKDICLRVSWHKVVGVEQPVQLCYEWINTADPSGHTHTFERETEVVKGADGKLYYDDGARVDYRFFLLVAFLVSVLALGMRAQRWLIARYRSRLERGIG